MAIVLISQLCINVRPVAAQEYGKIIWFVQVPPQGPDPPTPPEEKIIWFVQIVGPGGPEEPITFIQPCKWDKVVATDPDQPGFTPPPCSWWHIFFPEQMYCIYFHVDMVAGPGEFHVGAVLPERRIGPVEPPAFIAYAEWIPPIEPITKIEPCKWYRVIDTEPYQPGFVPPVCSWWHIFWPPQLYSTSFHVDKAVDQMFHIDIVEPDPIPVVDPPVDIAKGEWTQPVGGVGTPVDKLTLLAPYITLTSTIISAVAVTAVFFKRKKK
jgi:hypothetical protein